MRLQRVEESAGNVSMYRGQPRSNVNLRKEDCQVFAKELLQRRSTMSLLSKLLSSSDLPVRAVTPIGHDTYIAITDRNSHGSPSTATQQQNTSLPLMIF